MTYEEAIDYLTNLTTFGINFGLGRIRHLLEQLGNPHRGLKVIHVGGTNGKGSTCAIVSSILQAAGYKAGLFTSPHLQSYTERTKINGTDIAPGRVAELIERLRPILERMVKEGHEHPTEFEVNTALSLLYFYEENVDLVVLEVGLGGAIDSTNVIDEPLVSVITNVGMDHMNYLGNSIEDIARVKAGIIKPGRHVVTAADRAEALAVIEETCRKQRAELFRVGKDVTWEEINAGPDGLDFNLSGLSAVYRGLHLPLLGRHQLVNAATAVLAVELLAYRQFRVGVDAVRQGLAGTTWPGRLEIMHHHPTVLIDLAHNYDGAVTLRRAIEELFTCQKLLLVIGMLADKERERVMGLMAPLAANIVVTKPLSPRAGDWQELASMAARHCTQVQTVEDPVSAAQEALSLAGPDDLVCITGSFYMVAEVRQWLLESKFSGKCSGRQDFTRKSSNI